MTALTLLMNKSVNESVFPYKAQWPHLNDSLLNCHHIKKACALRGACERTITIKNKAPVGASVWQIIRNYQLHCGFNNLACPTSHYDIFGIWICISIY